MSDPVTNPATGGLNVFNPLSSWGGNTPQTNPAIADLYNRGWLNPGKSFNLALPGMFSGVQFDPALSGGSQPYASSGAQIQDALGMPSRYASGWEWGNGAPRYGFANGGQPPQPGAGGMFGGGMNIPTPPAQGAPTAQPTQAGTGMGGMFTPVLTAPSTQAPARAQGFGAYAAAPANTPPPTSMNVQPGGAQPQRQDGAYQHLINKGYSPQRAQAAINQMAAGPQQMGEWGQLGNDTARGQYLQTHPGFARELLNSGNMSHGQSTLYSLLSQGYSGR